MTNEIPEQEGQIIFSWKFQCHMAGNWQGWGISGGATLFKCRNTSAIKEVISGKNGKTWFYPSATAREEFNTEDELRKFLSQ